MFKLYVKQWKYMRSPGERIRERREMKTVLEWIQQKKTQPARGVLLTWASSADFTYLLLSSKC